MNLADAYAALMRIEHRALSQREYNGFWNWYCDHCHGKAMKQGPVEHKDGCPIGHLRDFLNFVSLEGASKVTMPF